MENYSFTHGIDADILNKKLVNQIQQSIKAEFVPRMLPC